MAIKYLKGIYGIESIKTTRPRGFEFPLGLRLVGSTATTANSADSVTPQTFDVFIVAGGNGSSRYGNPPDGNTTGPRCSGGGGAGGVRLFSANNFNTLPEYQNLCSISATSENFIPIIVGGSGSASCFSNIENTAGGRGGAGGSVDYGASGRSGYTGGSGGGGGLAWSPAPTATSGAGGAGTAGQGCGGQPAGGPGGSATAACSTTGGLTTSFTGESIRFGDGGQGGSPACLSGAANRGNGGQGGPSVGRPAPSFNSTGGSGIVAVRYRNPAAPTTPLATGGNCVCCTGGCIIHVFCSSGFLNLESQFSIN